LGSDIEVVGDNEIEEATWANEAQGSESEYEDGTEGEVEAELGSESENDREAYGEQLADEELDIGSREQEGDGVRVQAIERGSVIHAEQSTENATVSIHAH
jgi:hypothetical protein